MVSLHLFDESQTRLADFWLYPTMQIEKSERSKRSILARARMGSALFAKTNALMCPFLRKTTIHSLIFHFGGRGGGHYEADSSAVLTEAVGCPFKGV